MTGSFHVFSIFGIAVRIHWMLPVWLFILTGSNLAREGVGGGWTLYLLGLAGFAFLFVLLHEFGHCWAARRLGLSATEVVLGPLGGLATVGSSGRPWPEVAVAAAGPAVNAVVCAAAGAGMALRGEPWTWTHLDPLQTSCAGVIFSDLFRLSWFQLVFNLFLPVFPLDGGRILQGLLAVRMGYERATLAATSVAMGVAVALMLGGLLTLHFLVALAGLFVFVQAFALRRLLREGGLEAHPEFPGADAGRSWLTPDPAPPRRRRPGFFARLRQRRAAASARRREEEEVRIRERVDQLLEKVSRGGLASLSPDERRFLDQASRRYEEFAARRED